MAREISKFDDVIDSRDVIARLEELEDERDAAKVDDLDADLDEGEERDTAGDWVSECGIEFSDDWDEARETEYQALRALADEAEGYAADWRHGETLIRDSYFEEYARQLAEDIGAIDRNASWPNTCIDWEQAASELQQDYTAVDFDGETYWVR